MAKIRVHELAKELEISSKDVIQLLSDRGIEAKAPSSIADEVADEIRSTYKKNAKTDKNKEDIKEDKNRQAEGEAKADTNTENKAEETKAEVKPEKKEEDKPAKPKRIITSKGVVIQGGSDAERRRRPRPDGERHRRPDGERHKRPMDQRNGAEAKKQELTPEMMKARFEQALNKKSGKDTETVKTESTLDKTGVTNTQTEKTEEKTKAATETVKTETTVTETATPKEETVAPKVETVAPKVETTVAEDAKKEAPKAEAKVEAPRAGKQEVRADHEADTTAKTEEDKNLAKQAETQNKSENIVDKPVHADNNQAKTADRPKEAFQDRNGNGERRQGGYQDRNGNGERRQGGYQDRNGNGERRQGGYQDRNGNGERRQGGYQDRNGNGERRQGGYQDRNNDRRQGGFAGKDSDSRQNSFNARNDRRRTEGAQASEVIQDKDRKSRENKLRQDKQDRNKKNFEDGQRSGRNGGKGFQLQHKSMLQKPQKKKEEKKEEIKIISIPEVITIGELAEKMKMPASTIIKKLFLEGKMVTVNSELDFESAEEIAMGYEIMCEQEVKVDAIEELLKEDTEDEETMVKRPPVVCVMGHVDHGKTSLLDAIKQTNVIESEAGGITQHIGAYMVEINGQKITFLDTPGHEAFTAMRMRGAQSTDIAILVVAADDGVMPQTIEAINHAKAAEIEIIVAINKIDKPGANIDRVKQELAEYELLAEDWGGSTIMVPVSAHTGEGIDTLLEMVLLQADILELKANPDRLARGLVIEAKLDKGKGSVANILIQKGTLRVGDYIAAGSNHGRVRAMVDDKGRQVTEATPSTPVSILGLNGVPNAGEVIVSTETSNEARAFSETFIKESKEKLLAGTKYRLSLEDLNSQIEAGNLKELNLIIKADVQGSVEAIKQSMLKLSNEEVEVKVIHGGVGAINESDVILASASNAIIIGFNVKPDNQAQDVAGKEQVDIRLYNVIYRAIEDVEAAMKGMLDPIFEEKIIGHAEIRQIFKASGVGNIAGSYVLDGVFERGCSVRISREGTQIFEGQLASLKRFKDDVKEVKTGFECGLVFEGFNDIQELDQVEAYKMVEVPR